MDRNSPAETMSTAGLSRRFREIRAVESLVMHVSAGSVYGFLGPNGAGKTTTIRMLLGLIRPDRGDIFFWGKHFLQHRLEMLGRIGALVETPSAYLHLTGREHLRLIQKLRNQPQNNIDRALDIVRLTAAADRTVKTYSHGMRQRLGIAMALMGSPELLILDEPTNGLDPEGIIEIRQLIGQLLKELGVTVFLSSHLLNEVEQTADTIGIIKEGMLLFQGTLRRLKEEFKNHVCFTVDRVDEVLVLLDRMGQKVIRHDRTSATVALDDLPKASEVNRMLVQNGISVFAIAPKEKRLEDLFLQLTRQGG
jgi:ABC-type multidrug transport system ATPase subunit